MKCIKTVHCDKVHSHVTPTQTLKRVNMGHNENKIYINLLRIIIHYFSVCDTTLKWNQETLHKTTKDNLLPI